MGIRVALCSVMLIRSFLLFKSKHFRPKSLTNSPISITRWPKITMRRHFWLKMAWFTSGLQVHFHAGWKKQMEMHCFAHLVMLIELLVSDLWRKCLLFNSRNDRINRILHSTTLIPVCQWIPMNPYTQNGQKCIFLKNSKTTMLKTTHGSLL